MGKHLESVTNFIEGMAKALPLIAGAGAGLVSPARDLMLGDTNAAMLDSIQNYTFINTETGKFDLSKGFGVKSLTAGLIVHKVVAWIAG